MLCIYIYISQIKFLIWYYVCMEYYWWNMIIKWPLSSCYTDEYDYKHLDYWHNEWNVILNIYIYIYILYICHICNIIFNVTYVYIHAHTIDILFSQSWGSWNRPISTRLRLQIMSRQGDQQLAPPVQCAWGTCPWLQASNETGTWYLVIVFLVFFLCLKTEHQVPLKCWKHWHWSQENPWLKWVSEGYMEEHERTSLIILILQHQRAAGDMGNNFQGNPSNLWDFP